MDVTGLTSLTGAKGKNSRGRFVAATTAERVSASTLHQKTRPTLDLLRTSEAVAVTHYNEVEGYLVAPDRYDSLVEDAARAAEREDELKATLPMLLAAARAGVAIPSETLERLLPGHGADDWRALAEFAATFPSRLSAGEHGEPITRAHLSSYTGPIEESGTDDDLNLD